MHVKHFNHESILLSLVLHIGQLCYAVDSGVSSMVLRVLEHPP